MEPDQPLTLEEVHAVLDSIRALNDNYKLGLRSRWIEPGTATFLNGQITQETFYKLLICEQDAIAPLTTIAHHHFRAYKPQQESNP